MDYKELVEVYKELESTTKRLEKTEILAKFLKKVSKDDIREVMYLSQGKVFPPWDERKLGMSGQLVVKAIVLASGSSKVEVDKMFRKIGDYGEIARDLIKDKKQGTLASQKLSIKKVFENMRKLSSLEGVGTVSRKIGLIAELLSNAKPEEARFIVRTVLEQLRIGIAEGIIRDALAQAYNVDVKEVERAYDLLVDYAEVAEAVRGGHMGRIKLKPGRPIKVMLAPRVEDILEAFKAVGKPAQFEYKLDGFRVEAHYDGKEIKLYTRRLEDVSKQFQDVVEVVKEHVKGESFILDCEVVGIDAKSGKYLPFQKISQRIRRKYNIEDMAKKFPVELNVFDIMYYNGKNLISSSLEERRKILEKIVKEKNKKIVLTKKLVTSSEKDAEKFYNDSLKAGNEGVMVKNVEAKYKAGRYVNGWVKLKPVMQELDLVIVGAEYGTGKRAGVLSSYIFACRDPDSGEFLSCGMMSSGIKEKGEDLTYEKVTKMLKPLIVSTKGKEVVVKPEIVMEISYEEIQKSPTYKSGYALRFPRFSRLRDDRTADEINTIGDIERLYKFQRGRK